jgi:hypothetical protein
MHGIGLYDRGLNNALDVQRVDIDLICPDLPDEFDGFRILHVSDPHFDLCPGVTEAIRAASADRRADLCVMTGDYRAACDGPFTHVIAALDRLLPDIQAPMGVLATLGNHDSVDMVEAMESLGIVVLANEAATIRRGEAELRLVGLDDVHKFYTPLAEEALTIHAPAGDRAFSVALVHSADMATRAARLGYGLYLCGHTHGGQICLPGGLPLMTHQDSPRRLAQGLWRVGGMHGYTSSGAGASLIPLRYFSRAEVTRFTLWTPRTDTRQLVERL